MMRAFTRRSSIALGILLGLTVVPVTTATAQTPFASAVFDGYSTGSALHVDALQGGITGPTVAKAQAAFSGATVASQGTNTIAAQGPNAKPGQIVNEMDQIVQNNLPDTTLDPNLKGNLSYGRGSGVEVGLVNTLPTATNQVMLAGRAFGSALPGMKDPVVKEIKPLPTNPLAYASLLRGTAQAKWNDDSSCILGEPISQGSGYAADVQLVNTGAANPDGTMKTPVAAADAPTPERNVVFSRSFTQLVPQTDAKGAVLGRNWGLMSETRQTYAPITLFKGTANQLTIEIAGEWVLRTVATGVGGTTGNWVFYGPRDVSPQTPVVRVIRADGTIAGQLTTQMIPVLGPTGLVVTVPGVAEIAIGEDPREIGGAATTNPKLSADGTSAAAAVDIVRIKLLEQRNAQGQVTQGLADIRVGHMESRAKVPVGGISCALPVSKTSDKQTVAPDETFTYTITVKNPFADCDLTEVKVVDTITTDPGIRYTIGASTPPADSTTANSLTWNDIGPIKPNQSKSVTVSISVNANSAPGKFTNTAVASGKCATGRADGLAKVVVPIEGNVVLVAPEIVGVLAKTGGAVRYGVLGMMLLGAAALARIGLRGRRSEV